METFTVGEKVRFTMFGKSRLSKIVSFVPNIEGGVLATAMVEGKEYTISTGSLRKTGKEKQPEKDA